MLHLLEIRHGHEYKKRGDSPPGKELARITGEKIAEAVDRAVSDRLERLRRQRNRKAPAATLLKIGEECSRLPVLDARSPDEMLYDEHGLPR